MSGQLLIFIIVLMIPPIIFYVIRIRELPTKKKDEAVWSREFWMFIGSLVFLLSVFQISFTTSYPVVNKLFGTNLAVSTEPIRYYNSFQLGFALLISILSASVQYFNYRDTALGLFWTRIRWSFLVSILVTVLIFLTTDLHLWYHIALLFTLSFSAIANGWYFVGILKGKARVSGASISHLGFAMLLMGILLSGGQQRVISLNNSGKGFSGFTDEESRENILLVQNRPTPMANYLVTYLNDSVSGHNKYFKLLFERLDASGKVDERFELFPNMQKSEMTGDVPNPDTRHYLGKDIYTHVTAVSIDDENAEPIVSDHTITMGDTVALDGCYMILTGFNSEPLNERYVAKPDDIAVGAKVLFKTLDKTYAAEPVYVIRDHRVGLDVMDEVKELDIQIRLTSVHPKSNSFTFQISQTPTSEKFITLRAIVFPQINLLWLGSIVMVIGIFLSMQNRRKQVRNEPAQ
jgi:cytochrome c-type biogenesis protein CcmF